MLRWIRPSAIIPSVSYRGLCTAQRNQQVPKRTTMSVESGAQKRSPSPLNVPTEKRPRTTSPTHTDNASEKKSNGTTRTHLTKAEKKRRKKLIEIDPGSHDDVLWHEVISLLGEEFVETTIEVGKDFAAPFAFREEVEVRVVQLSSNGMFEPIPRYEAMVEDNSTIS